MLNFSDRNGSIRGELVEVSEVELIEHDITSNEDTAHTDGMKEVEIKNEVEHKKHSLTKDEKCGKLQERRGCDVKTVSEILDSAICEVACVRE